MRQQTRNGKHLQAICKCLSYIKWFGHLPFKKVHTKLIFSAQCVAQCGQLCCLPSLVQNDYVARTVGKRRGGQKIKWRRGCRPQQELHGEPHQARSHHCAPKCAQSGCIAPCPWSCYFLWTHTMQTHQAHTRTHALARAAHTPPLRRTAILARPAFSFFALLQKAEFALNSTAHCAVLGKRSWI